MNKKTMKRMSDAVIEIAEKFTFLVGDPESKPDSGQAPVSRAFRSALMHIEAPDKFVVRIAAPLSLCRKFASNLLAVEDSEVTSASAEDALKEFLNVLCGCFASSVYGDKKVVELTPPRVGGMSLAKWKSLCRDERTQLFNIEGQTLAVSIVEGKG